MRLITNLLFSSKTTLLLLISFALAMAIGTFIESGYGTPTAVSMIYKAWWFEAIMLLLSINFIGNIFKYKLFSKAKWAVLLFHLSFVLILYGAFVTRYIGYEGMMAIKEGEVNNVILSENTYLKLKVSSLNSKTPPKIIYKKLLLSTLKNYPHEVNINYKGKEINSKITSYTPNYQTLFIADKNEKWHLELVEASSGSRKTHFLPSGETILINNLPFSFNNFNPSGINIFYKNDSISILTPYEGSFMRMSDKKTGAVLPSVNSPLMLRSLYTIGNLNFVIPSPPKQGKVSIKKGDKNKNNLNLLTLNITAKDSSYKESLEGNQFALGSPKIIYLNDIAIELSYGSKPIMLPFYIKLKDFQLEKFPGSNSPKSFASEVSVIDEDKVNDYRIFMNHPLDYKGFKFFQSSYSITNTYEETYLSVNRDPYGAFITYIGYTLLFLGLLLSLILPKTRFQQLRKLLKKLNTKTTTLFVILFCCSSIGFSEKKDTVKNPISEESLISELTIDKNHCQQFGLLSIQDNGRMKPVNTFSNELLRKIYKKNTFHGLTSDQVLVSMIVYPRVWVFIPIIYLESANIKVRSILGLNKEKYATVLDFFTKTGEYRLIEEVEKARKSKIKSKYEESLIKIDIRLNLMYSFLNGYLSNLFPTQKSINNKWINPVDLNSNNKSFSSKDSNEIADLYYSYLDQVPIDRKKNDYTKANQIINTIRERQLTVGKEVAINDYDTLLETTYNRFDIFKSLYSKYLFASLIYFIIIVITIFKKRKGLLFLSKGIRWIIYILFIAQTLGLIVRGYISGHAPWSDAYESMIYISWATMLFGILFGRKSAITLAATAFVNAMILMIAHWNFMDPSISNLQPVLDSYWLMIHVAIIVGSYGPFTLSMILGLISLITIATTTKTNKTKLNPVLKELTIINEMAINVGLVMLTIGNFLGGMWANESWGRYWGWDPKETWALISIMVYAFIIHARLVPALKGKWIFNTLTVFGFTTILMTYFGVNFFLSGLHSYAKGNVAKIPDYIYYIYLAVTVITIIAYFKKKKYYNN